MPGATARQQIDFGDVTGYGKMGAEYFSFGAGTDITELLRGLEDDSCQSPHWGDVIKGSITALYTDGGEETSRAGDLFFWPPGHSVRAEEDTDFVMFSPQKEHGADIDHIRHKINSESVVCQCRMQNTPTIVNESSAAAIRQHLTKCCQPTSESAAELYR